jgi:hypothetical protein
MGWGSFHGANHPESQYPQQTLLKEHRVENRTLRAKFPQAVANERVLFEIEASEDDTVAADIVESVSLQIHRTERGNTDNTYTELKPDPTLSGYNRWVFPYRFSEPGNYKVIFKIYYQPPSTSLTSSIDISARRLVSRSYASHHNYSMIPWIAGGAVMTGLMIWMMAD